MSVAFMRKQDEKLFWCTNWARQNAFGKMCTTLSLKFGVLIVGEMKQQFF